MEKIIDKIIIAICCMALGSLALSTSLFVIAMLLGLTISALHEVRPIPRLVLSVLHFGYLLACFFVPTMIVFAPLVAYDCMDVKPWPLRILWVLPLLAAVQGLGLTLTLAAGAATAISCAFAWRTARITAERQSALLLQDELRELSIQLAQKNHDLRERQDLELHLATLSERGRIAREIHDNVGHLLTRSVLQLKAAQVVHADDAALCTELANINDTLDEAFASVRSSVHDLHNTAFDLAAELRRSCTEVPFSVEMNNDIEDVPESVGYSLLAIVKEALSNTAKHSDATRVVLQLHEHPAMWQLVVQDNGSHDPFGGRPSGVQTAGSLEQKGIGLKNMAERVRSLNGIFRIDYNKGFRVFVSIPKTQDA